MTTDDEVSLCRNCDTELKGEYCHNCGQSSVVVRRPSRELLNDALGNILQWDSRLFQSLKLLFFRPGQLSVLWVEGKRMRYVPPFRLYIVASFILFLLIGMIAQPNALEIKDIDLEGPTFQSLQTNLEEAREKGEWFSALVLQSAIQLVQDPVGYFQKIVSNLPKAAFFFLPLFALISMGVNLRRGKYYIDHVVFSLHFHSFAFLLVSLQILAGFIYQPLGDWSQVTNFFIPVYGVLALKTFTQDSWGKSILKGIILFGTYSVVLTIGIGLYIAVIFIL